MNKIVPHLWYDGAAEEAAALYVGLFPDAALGEVTRYPGVGQETHGQPEGRVVTVGFRIGGTELVALNAGPAFRFTPAVSLFATLATVAEVDRVWDGLVEGGSVLMPLDTYPWSGRYGWLSDRWGLSWQVCLGIPEESGGALVPSLMFTRAVAGRAEEAIDAYVAAFPDAGIMGLLRNDGSGEDAAGTVRHAQFRLAGQVLMAMDSAGPHDFTFNEALSLMVLCEDQAEIDHYWSALSAVPEAEMCGWLRDRFGVVWQITPRTLLTMMRGDPARAGRVMRAFMNMKKLDLAALERAAAEPGPTV